MGEQRDTESERVLLDEKRRKMGKVGVFLERAVGRGWTMDGDARVRGVTIALIVALLWTPVFPLDLYSGTHPYIWRQETTR